MRTAAGRRLARAVAVVAWVGVTLFSSEVRGADADPWISRDKAFHFDVSAGIAAVGYGISAAWIVDARWKALAIGGGAALAAGAGKEILDATGLFGGDPSWKDFAWDAMGAVAGLAIAWGVDLLVGGVDSAHPPLGSPRTEVAPASLGLRF
jgi:putative lipoprotein